MGTSGEHDWADAIARARRFAPFLMRALERQPDLGAFLAAGDGEGALEWSRAHAEHEDTAVALRRHRLALATTLAIGDLAGAFTLDRVMDELSRFADHALDKAIRSAIFDRTGEDRSDGMIALALGKQGAHELNYSSDIDPILLYDPKTLPCREKDDPGEAAQRYARRVVNLLSDNTAERYVLRVDLRLRPASEISPPAVPVSTALTHYQGQALAWERAAFIRARAAAGDIQAGEAFLSEIAPFIWRPKLDFGAVKEIRTLTQRIRADNEGADSPGPGFDVKKGRGGIREIEFFAQTHQLIHAGRDPSLRVRGTRAALNALAAAGWIDADHARVLGEGYDRLRVIEHRLQMVDDRQTHSLPSGEALDRVAQLDGMADGDALVAELTELTAKTGAIYDELIGQEAPAPYPQPKPESRATTLAQMGFADADALAQRIEDWRDGRYASIRSPQALEAFDRLLPRLLDAIARSDDPERAITRFQAIIERTQSAIELFRLLTAEPRLIERLVNALTLSPRIASTLARRPETLDVLLDRQPIDFEHTYERTLARLRDGPGRSDYEAKLDCIRQVVSEARFTLEISLLEAEHKPSRIAAALSHVAEAAITAAVEAAHEEFAQAHGRIKDSELLVLGLGRLGGGALSPASDLDMIYLFKGEYGAESDGERPLGATLYYNRLATRVNAALSVPTAQGALYEVDTRLRPQGNQGPLAVSIEAFAKYQESSAWTWEHMALNRARVLAGSDDARAKVEQIIARTQCQVRNPLDLQKDVLKMRGDMAEHKPPKGELDVKLMRGGLIDVEFLVHFIQLRDASKLGSDNPAMLSPDFALAIPALIDLGLLERELWPAYDLLTDVLVASRLLAPERKEPPPAAANALARTCGCSSYAELLASVADARKCVIRQWAINFDETLEI
ncbi:bifunctional [glutamate--ammonia ligase]-adenylyl-L-tyrosine phosphorylase/[glutamate--ammonia-ligase] adenylyltransferase [Erythrobacter sp. SCSIO 43205]|uniref:bifunctional [glutamate--ammonia ligase]-adenylyl-L-tyrosine phosphorylase/[glutamate--ammonia-ligase] adenylyltransferase n=1 Tax=Erythrobacter sp. SCSIO 43205 TaxID=2779361 RepID=UPI001CA80730|nr:bifunctional [glutamate--ammonia ligase]-adenylyl-L-tyrosine phosphorylase/[glutamate--ammonia-ligase] adenylyltransferase [Erythrobacter sp. SCSIO 43205]UAB78570.1 bifunctional [glutamate--ammonia ligase]-adenylyl-L-tyrosine phosphorylase/[glutamate--ammonia-ligase] adenylyltransferase [Erythrobacter sp. SCSIO 43205]